MPQVTVTDVGYRGVGFSVSVGGSDYFRVFAEYGTSTSYESVCCDSTYQAGNYNLSFAINMLQPGTTYHLRAVTTDGLGCCGPRTDGPSVTFTTKPAEPPTFSTIGTDWFGDCSCLNIQGGLATKGAATTVRYEYGATPALGLATAPQVYDPDAWGSTTLIYGQIRDLAPETTYYWRAVVANEAGTTSNATAAFTTPGSAPQPGPGPPSNPAPSPTPSPAPAPVTPATPAPPTTSAESKTSMVRAYPALTPGARNPAVTQATIRKTICNAAWRRAVRPASPFMTRLRLQLMRKYNLAGPPSRYRLDHLIPLELGGAPRDARNLWPQAAARAAVVDALELKMNRSVCTRKVTLAAAQAQIVRLKRDRG